MTKAKLNFLDVVFDTKPNKDGVLSRQIFVSIDKSEKTFTRFNEFLSRAEQIIFNNKYKYDFDNSDTIDVSSHVTQVELCKNDNKYGKLEQYILVHFDIGYDKRINIESDDYFLLNNFYTVNNVNSAVEIDKNQKK